METKLTFDEQLELYKELAAAVIIQAAFDYQANKEKYLKAKTLFGRSLATKELSDITEFFYSPRFRLFSNMDGRYLFKIVKEVCQPKKRGRNASLHI